MNGRIVTFRRDNQLGLPKPFIDHALLAFDADQINACENEFVINNSDQDWNLLCQILPSYIVSKIQAIYPPKCDVQKDCWTWQDSYIGLFSVKNANKVLIHHKQNVSNFYWKNVQRSQAP